MKFVKLADLVENNKLANHIYSNRGQIILRNGTVLTKRFIDLLSNYNLVGVYIEDENLKGVEIEEGLDALYRVESAMKLEEQFKKVKQTGKFDLREIQKISNYIMETMISKPNFLVQLRDVRSQDNYRYFHSINVCMLSVMAAKGLSLELNKIRDIALGALLHDMGYAYADANESNHGEKGYNLLRQYYEINLLSAHMAYQHHEKLNGEGFPRKIKGKDFIEYAQICALANEYDHAVNDMKEALPPHEAIELLMSKADTEYDSRIVKAFIQNIAPYPVGTYVKINGNREALVIHVDKSHPSRPTVMVKGTWEKINLIENSTIFIQEISN